MNKKLLLATMSLAVLAACTNDDDFGSKNIAENASPVQFEVLNNNQALTRATMDGNTIQWSAEDGDLFTLYHGCNAENEFTTGYQNATYKASSEEGAAILSTPSMILPGKAIMVWPVDTTFRIASDGALSITIPAVQTNIENSIPYVSDLINIGAYDGTKGAPNTAGYNRTYPVYMRPMASQLIVNADYAGTDATIAKLYDGGEACPADGGIEPIKVTSLELTDETNQFTKVIPIAFTEANTEPWKNVKGNAWAKVTNFGTASEKVTKLITKCLTGNESAKFLILPQAAFETGKGEVVVNTIYGKVTIKQEAGYYSEDEIKDAWYRYVSATTAAATGETKATAAETTGDNAGKYKTYATVAGGLRQTINAFSTYKAQKGIVKGEPIGAAATRYVKVLLNKLDMSDLHITSDKQLRDAAVVWKYLYPEATDPITVILDGNEDGEFAISQNTIKYINTLKKADGSQLFNVKPCTVAGEVCKTIVITGGGDIQDLPFIVKNGQTKVDVAFNKGETWNWKATGTTAATKTVKVGAGVSKFINRGTLVNAATATLANYGYGEDALIQTNVPLVNEGTWNITAGTLNVQFSVTNLGTVNIAKGAQYRQDGTKNIFRNNAETLPERFVLADPSIDAKLKAKFVEKIGVVNNNGVFATVNDGKIYNFGLIEHADKDAKTYITKNQTDGMTFATAFVNDPTTLSKNKKIGRINLPYSNKDEDNISISAAAAEGFVSVTVTTADAPATKNLDASVVGTNVNYLIINSGIEHITAVSNQVKYVEINSPGTEVEWEIYKDAKGVQRDYVYDGLMVLSDVNIKLGNTVKVNQSTFLGADMYVGGTFTYTSWAGYFGNTMSNAATKYITY